MSFTFQTNGSVFGLLLGKSIIVIFGPYSCVCSYVWEGNDYYDIIGFQLKSSNPCKGLRHFCKWHELIVLLSSCLFDPSQIDNLIKISSETMPCHLRSIGLFHWVTSSACRTYLAIAFIISFFRPFFLILANSLFLLLIFPNAAFQSYFFLIFCKLSLFLFIPFFLFIFFFSKFQLIFSRFSLSFFFFFSCSLFPFLSILCVLFFIKHNVYFYFKFSFSFSNFYSFSFNGLVFLNIFLLILSFHFFFLCFFLKW